MTSHPIVSCFFLFVFFASGDFFPSNDRGTRIHGTKICKNSPLTRFILFFFQEPFQFSYKPKCSRRSALMKPIQQRIKCIGRVLSTFVRFCSKRRTLACPPVWPTQRLVWPQSSGSGTQTKCDKCIFIIWTSRKYCWMQCVLAIRGRYFNLGLRMEFFQNKFKGNLQYRGPQKLGQPSLYSLQRRRENFPLMWYFVFVVEEWVLVNHGLCMKVSQSGSVPPTLRRHVFFVFSLFCLCRWL